MAHIMTYNVMNYKKLLPTAKEPTYGSDEAAGADLYAAEAVWIHPGEVKLVDTGIAVEIPENYFGGLFPRSGLATKRGLRLANCVGVIDSDYRGPVKVALFNDSNKVQEVEVGERIAQMIVIPYITTNFVEVKELSDTIRGEGGFGSTGTK